MNIRSLKLRLQRGMNKKGTLRGFTIIELLVVVAIIAILATLITLSLTNAQVNSRDTKRRSDVAMIMNAVVMYAADHNGDVPPADGNIETTGTTGYTMLDTYVVKNGYIDKMPTDPKCHGANCTADVISQFTGYSYYASLYLLWNATSCTGAPSSYGSPKKGFVFASLEKPSAEDNATMNSFDICATATYKSYMHSAGASLNYKIGN